MGQISVTIPTAAGSVLSDSQQNAVKNAEIRVQGLIGELGKLDSATRDLGIELAEEGGLLETMTKLVQKTTEWVSKLGEASPKTMQWVAGIGVGLSLLGPFLVNVGQAAIGIALLAKGLALVGLRFGVLRVAVAGLFKLFGKLLNPIQLVAGFLWRIVGFGSRLGAILTVLRTIALAIAAFIGGLVSVPAAIVVAIVAALASLAALIWKFRDEIVLAISNAWEASAEAARAAFSNVLSWLFDKFMALWDLIPSREDIASAWEGSTLGKAINKIPGFATGAVDIRGPGTGTSDSILAWLSNGESVISSAATRFWGPGFLDAVNNMVMPPMPAMAAAGAAPAGRVLVDIPGPGGSMFTLEADEETANRMSRYYGRASSTRMKSASRFQRRG
ncbi:hypothetical protein EV655_1191 [Rhodovulum euryhalinum]|uniref:Phage tail tape measure protein n=2 Tax=Rhodovulum euryhalinum TaxID=35805 RepID=A0A4R2KQX4_9RHOB|nr:hypothetical protein EV655_1191 [Rhodovulum euryhalinum]